jgi:hypothetical protein
MMTPKEKAQELVKKFTAHSYHNDNVQQCFDHAKQCALIAVDEILQSLGYKSLSDSPYTTLEARQYYVQVKQEIENL